MREHKIDRLTTPDGSQIYVEVSGEATAQTLVFLHGGMQSSASFDGLIAALPADRFRCIRIDSRGHGRSRINGALNYETLQRDTEQVLQHLNVNRCTVIGHSDGGTVALRLALAGVIAVERIVCIGAQWKLEPGDPAIDFYATLTAEGWQAQFPENVAAYEALNPQPDLPRMIAGLVALWSDTGPQGYPGDAVANLTVPLLVMRGDDDFLMSRAEAFSLAERVPSATLLNLPFTGHSLHEEAPELTAGIIMQFLNHQPE